MQMEQSARRIDFIGKMTVKKARAYIIELLKKQNLLVKQETIRHMVAVHERCQHEVESLCQNSGILMFSQRRTVF